MPLIPASRLNFRRQFFPAPPEEVDLDLLPSLEGPGPRAEDYDDRAGYDPAFLGDGSEAFLAPLPLLQNQDDLVPVERAPDDRPFELRYEKFSVVMSRSRRLCCVTGVNIDGAAPFFKTRRPGWRTDPRVPRDLQVDGDEFYVPTVFDRGHMVRRVDPTWGDEAAANLANRDTHHYTNSCPQVHSFNDGIWGDLEDWILSQEQTRDHRAAVFTGPIFRDDDPVYAGVAVPVTFFKLIAVVDDELDRLSVTAFTLDQSGVLPPQEEAAILEAPFDPGAFVHDQITVQELEDLTGLDLARFKEFDVLASFPVPEAAFTGPLRIPLTGPHDVVLWAARS